MKYIAEIKRHRNGTKLVLYRVVFNIKIPIEEYSRFFNEDLDNWVSYYGDKLKVIDNR